MWLVGRTRSVRDVTSPFLKEGFSAEDSQDKSFPITSKLGACRDTRAKAGVFNERQKQTLNKHKRHLSNSNRPRADRCVCGCLLTELLPSAIHSGFPSRARYIQTLVPTTPTRRFGTRFVRTIFLVLSGRYSALSRILEPQSQPPRKAAPSLRSQEGFNSRRPIFAPRIVQTSRRLWNCSFPSRRASTFSSKCWRVGWSSSTGDSPSAEYRVPLYMRREYVFHRDESFHRPGVDSYSGQRRDMSSQYWV